MTSQRACRAALGISLSCLSLFSAESANAQTPPADKASAETLFNDGIALVAAGKFVEGCEKFEGSQSLEPTLGTELRLADCYAKVGRTASAWALFRETQGLAHRSGQLDRENLSRERAEVLEPILSFLTIEAEEPSAPGLRVERDHHLIPLASLDVKIPVDPGPHLVVVTAPSRKTWSKEVRVAPNAGAVTVRVPRLELAPVARRPSVASSASSPPSQAQRTAGVVTSIVGMAGLLSGASLGLYAKRENDRSRTDAYCPADNRNGCSLAGVELRDRARNFATATTITLIASSAVLATGVVLWTTASKSSEVGSSTSLRLSASGTLASVATAVSGTF